MPAAPTEPSSHGNAEPGQQVPYPPYPFFIPPEEDEINLLELFRILWKRKWLISFVTALGTGAAVAYAFLATPIYRAKAVIAPPEQKQAGAASAALAAFGGIGAEIAGSMGISLGSTDANRLEALLKSHRLIARTVEKHALLPLLFAEDWDPTRGDWSVDEAEDIPNIWDAEKELDDIYLVKNDAKAGTLRISFDFHDKQVAQKVLGYFLEELALVVQEDELRKIEANKGFAQEQLQKATDPAIISRLQTLLSEQVEKAMMAQNIESFAYELIDPPSVSDRKVKPQRALLIALGATLSLFSGVFLAFSRAWLEQARAKQETGG